MQRGADAEMTSETIVDKWIEGISKECTVGDAARASLRQRLSAVYHFLPLAAKHASQNVEHVHLLRVWSRRSTAAFRIYKGVLPKKQLRNIRSKLERIRRAAGEARDLDVLLGQIDATQAHGSTFFASLVRRRKKAQRHIRRFFDRAYGRWKLFERLEKMLTHINEKKESAGSFGDWAKLPLKRIVDRFYFAFPSDNSDLRALHRFRVRVKDLRYTIELLIVTFPIEFKACIYPLIEELQELLGDINDRSVAIAKLGEWRSSCSRKLDRIELKKKMAQESEQLKLAQERFRGWWTCDVQSQILGSLTHLSAALDNLTMIHSVESADKSCENAKIKNPNPDRNYPPY